MHEEDPTLEAFRAELAANRERILAEAAEADDEYVDSAEIREIVRRTRAETMRPESAQAQYERHWQRAYAGEVEAPGMELVRGVGQAERMQINDALRQQFYPGEIQDRSVVGRIAFAKRGLQDDIVTAISHAIRLREGLPIKGRLHRDAHQLADPGANPKGSGPGHLLQKWCNYAGCVRGLSSADFGQLLTAAYSAVLPSWYGGDDLKPVCADVVSPNYRPVVVGTCDIDLPRAVPEEGDVIWSTVAPLTNTSQLAEYEIRLRIGRQALYNDEQQAISNMLKTAVRMLQRRDLVLAAATLLANANLSDGAPLVAAGNTQSGAGHTIAGLTAAIGKLASASSTLGNLGNCRPGAAMVSADLLGTYSVLCAAIYPALNIPLVLNSWLPAATCYLFAAADENPVLTRLRLPDAAAPTIYSSSTYNPDNPDNSRLRGEIASYPGIGISARYAVSIVASSRVGIVKITA